MVHISNNKSLSPSCLLPPESSSLQATPSKSHMPHGNKNLKSEILIIAIVLSSFAAYPVVPTSVGTSLNTNIFLLFASSEEKKSIPLFLLCV